MPSKQQRKMANVDLQEISGVDHPAHMREGWVVMKNATSEQVDGLFGPNDNQGVIVADVEVEKVEKAEHDAALARITELEAEKAELEKAAEKPVVDEQEELMKSLPEAIRKQLEAQDAEIAKSREDVQKERAARLDDQAITKSRTVFKHLAFDHEKVAPALRRIEESDPELHKELSTVLQAAEGQLESAGIFQELGASEGQTTTAGAMEEATTKARALVEAGTVKTVEQGITKAFSDNPKLYAQYMNEKAGK